jgi:hypothetical protein
MSAARADVDDALGVRRERRQRTEQRGELPSFARADATQSRRRQGEVAGAELGQARAASDLGRELAEPGGRVRAVCQKRREAALFALRERFIVELQEKFDPAAFGTPRGRGWRIDWCVDDVEYRGEHPQQARQLVTLAHPGLGAVQGVHPRDFDMTPKVTE